MVSNYRVLRLFWKNLYWYYRWGLVFGIAISLFVRRANMIIIFVMLSGALRPDGYLENSRFIREVVTSRRQLARCLTYFVGILLIGCMMIYFSTAIVVNQSMSSVWFDVVMAFLLSGITISYIPDYVSYVWHRRSFDSHYGLSLSNFVIIIGAICLLFAAIGLANVPSSTHILLMCSVSYLVMVCIFSYYQIKKQLD